MGGRWNNIWAKLLKPTASIRFNCRDHTFTVCMVNDNVSTLVKTKIDSYELPHIGKYAISTGLRAKYFTLLQGMSATWRRSVPSVG